MSLIPTLAIGTTNTHWATVLVAYVEWAYLSNQINENVYESITGKIKSLATGVPNPHYKDFIVSLKKILTSADEAKVVDIIKESCIVSLTNKLLVKQTNEWVIKKLYGHRNTLRDLALDNKYLFQLKTPEVTTLGYRFGSYYTTLAALLEKVTFDRRYVEMVNNNDSLGSFVDVHKGPFIDSNSPPAQDFLAKKLELFNTATFSKTKTNWFVETLCSLAEFGDFVVNDLKSMYDLGEVLFDKDSLESAGNVASKVLTHHSSGFWLTFDDYKEIISLLHDLFSKLDNLLKHLDIKKSVIEEHLVAVSFNKDKYLIELESLFARIFDGERKREVFDEIFHEAPEVDNMIYRVAQQLNNEYRHETKPVCCVGFTEGVVLFLGKIIPLLNFPLSMITVKFSFYGSDTKADKNKQVELEFDESKYNGKRVLIFDDLLEQGVTTVKFIEQAKAKVKAIDYKVCVLFTKNLPENVYGDPEFVGGILPNVWVVGYGFDTLFKHRNADAVGSIKEEFKTE
ncbi:hypothetical protein BEWA_017710 [Theileria equi strain WA]|uniref:Phosphoribosyltransferase domain-containing protein n=1 Tax=Theileria equi strain WA TaxID=1537102 RepID=L0ATR6_THEEQ|nr:hypothetical protein BEWA_017710 [Theileria equi strain WA]AFZ78930.1 hypothetical protein BEWA_017710 [Theileria equi strain WA]|eukprot:XP_004828596.1 hypothetical protein BEWA_017710 [Theileria equi strain WA]